MSAASKTDVMYEITYSPNFVPRHSLKVNVKTVTIDNEQKYFMKNHENGSLYDLSEFGNELWNLIDGKRTVNEITEVLEGMYKDVRPDFVRDSLLFYAEEGTLESVHELEKKKRLEIVSAFWVRFQLIRNSERFIQSIHRKVNPLLKRFLLWPILVLAVVMGLLFAGNFVSIFAHKENFEIMGSTIVGFFFYYFIVLAPVIAVHEISHALALVHYGGGPREMGTGLYFFGPMFYVDVTDAWTLDRYQRIMIYAAGSIAEILIASAIMIAQYLWQFPAPISHILTMVVFYVFYGLLIDLSPLLETDGYFILSDALKIPDLRAKSFNYIRTIAESLVKKSDEKKRETLTTKTKAILIIYAALAAVWAVYLVLRSLMVATYMAQDTAASVLNVGSAILLNNPLTISAVVLCVASVLYFSMVMSGYGLMIFTALKKAAKTTLRFEAIHDRAVSVFLYLPQNAPQSILKSLRQNTVKAAKGFTRNFKVRQAGSMCIAVLRMGGTKLAFVQVKEHFRNIEKKFDAVYASFVKRHRNAILESVGVYGSKETDLAFLLSKMGKQAASAGIPDAQAVISQVIDRQARTALYLLHSVCGKVWTVELRPTLLHEMSETLLPSLLVEDLSIADLYDEVEDFKKRNVYGFDSLANLAVQNQSDLREALLQPEKYQVISSFEPIRSRLIFVGRTQQIERVLDSFGGLFVCQTWCGFLDNLLSEVNLNLFALNSSSFPDAKSVRGMKDGELAVLDKNLSSLLTHERLASESLKNFKNYCKWANLGLQELGNSLVSTEGFNIGLFEDTLQINAENLAHLPSQVESFGALYQGVYKEIRKAEGIAKRELSERRPLIAKKTRKRLTMYPFFIIFSAILVFLGLEMFTDYVSIIFVSSALLLQLLFWIVYVQFVRGFSTVDRYPSLPFRQAHFFAFAFTESLYKLTTTANVLAPVEPTPS